MKLHRLSDYLNLYKSSKTFLGCSTQPVVHRSLVFSLAGSNRNEKELKEVAVDVQVINRLRHGITPLHYSTRKEAFKCTEILLLDSSRTIRGTFLES